MGQVLRCVKNVHDVNACDGKQYRIRGEKKKKSVVSSNFHAYNCAYNPSYAYNQQEIINIACNGHLQTAHKQTQSSVRLAARTIVTKRKPVGYGKRCVVKIALPYSTINAISKISVVPTSQNPNFRKYLLSPFFALWLQPFLIKNIKKIPYMFITCFTYIYGVNYKRINIYKNIFVKSI